MGRGRYGGASYHPDSCPRGVSYIYLLLCRDSGPIHVKVGLSDSPLARVQALAPKCPARPRELFFFEHRSRETVRRIEQALLLILRRWRTEGEWFCVELAEKAIFNTALRAAVEPHRDPPLYPCRWQRVSISALKEDGKRRRSSPP